MITWIPTALTLISLIGGGAVAYKTIGDNKEALKDKVDISEFESQKTFTRDARIRLAADVGRLEEATEELDEAVDVLERSEIESAGDIKLQLERLSTQQRTDREAVERQLQLILQMLERQNRSN